MTNIHFRAVNLAIICPDNALSSAQHQMPEIVIWTFENKGLINVNHNTAILAETKQLYEQL